VLISGSLDVARKSTRTQIIPAPQPPPRGWLRRVLFRPPVLLAMSLLTAGVLLYPSLRSWLPDLEELDEYLVSVADTRVNPPHRWVPRDFVERVIADAGLPVEVSLLDESLAPRLSQAFAASPWIARVESVRITRHHGIEVRLEYRMPVVMVESRTGVYPVDRDGVLLPPSDFSADDIAGFPLLRGVENPPIGPAGTAWNDILVLSGARLAEALTPDGDLARYWQPFALRSIEPLSPRDDEPLEFALVTSGGSRVIWGQSPGTDELEPSVAQKLARLESYITSHGPLDGVAGRRQIDIRPFDTIEVISLDRPDAARRSR
jgi:hypothetical protein